MFFFHSFTKYVNIIYSSIQTETFTFIYTISLSKLDFDETLV